MSQHLKYLSYIIRHKWFVFVAGKSTGAPLWRLLIHDWSKFLPCEWMPYARYFYGWAPTWDKAKIQMPGYPWEKSKEGRSHQFDLAWLHHQHCNPHHWQFWLLHEDSGLLKVFEMPEHFAREMLADWMGAGRAINGRWGTAAWYEKNRENIMLGHKTRLFVENLMHKVESQPGKVKSNV